MPRTYSKRANSRFSTFTVEMMSNAMAAVRSNQLSIRAAASKFGVNRSTLLYHLKNEYTRKVGKPSTLTRDEEAVLVQAIQQLTDWGFCTDRDVVTSIVEDLINADNRVSPFRNGKPGHEWMLGFENRWKKELTHKVGQFLPTSQAYECNEHIVSDFFEKLEACVDRLQIRNLPQNIFCVDRIGFETDVRQQMIICQHGMKNSHKTNAITENTYTVQVCCSAVGTFLLPYVVYKGNNVLQSWKMGDPENVKYTCSKSGFVEAAQFVQWLQKVFISETKNLIGGKLIIFGGYNLHLSKAVLDMALANNIELLSIPADTGSILQPLNGVFKSVKTKWLTCLMNYHNMTCSKNVNKNTFPQLLKTLIDSEAFSCSDAINGFEACGIYPVNQRKISSEKLSTAEFLIARGNLRGDEEKSNAFKESEASLSTSVTVTRTELNASTCVSTDIKTAVLEHLCQAILRENNENRKMIMLSLAEYLTAVESQCSLDDMESNRVSNVAIKMEDTTMSNDCTMSGACDVKIEPEESSGCAMSADLITQSPVIDAKLEQEEQNVCAEAEFNVPFSVSDLKLKSEIKLEPEESSICDDLIEQSFLNANCLSGRSESESEFTPDKGNSSQLGSSISNVSTLQISDVRTYVKDEIKINAISKMRDCSVLLRRLDITSSLKLDVIDTKKYQCEYESSSPKYIRSLTCKKNFCSMKEGIKSQLVREGQHRCTDCAKSFNFKIYLRRHKKYVHGDKKFKCDKCKFSSVESNRLKLHIFSVHMDEKPHQCPQCDACFPFSYKLMRHIKCVHNREKPYECSACDKRFSAGHHLDRHRRSVHYGVKPYTCDQCDYKCSERGRLTQHQKHVHEKVKRFGCAECGYKSSTKGILKQHWIAVHYQQKSYSCSECDKAFNTVGSLKKHTDAAHRGFKPHSCSECGKAFSFTASLKKHIDASHKGLKRYSCNECGKAFSQRTHLTGHVNAIHKGLKSHSCTECDRSFSFSENLQRHIKFVHRKTEKLHSCSVCSKSFSTMTHVRVHVAVVHDGYKPHQCKECGKRFSMKAHFSYHMKAVHDGSKPYQCKQCRKTFSEKVSLIRHTKKSHK